MHSEKIPPKEEPTRADVIAEAAAKIPDVIADVDRLQAAWRVLASPRTPIWKRVLVGLEVARLIVAKRLRKASQPTQPAPAQDEAGRPAGNQE